MNNKRAKKSIQLRLYNKLRVLQALRRMGSASKADLARYANLTNTAIGDIIISLEKSGLIVVGEKTYNGARGQPATKIRLNKTGAYGIGVQIDRNKIETILIDFDGNVISRRTHEEQLPPPEKTSKIIQRDIKHMLQLLDGEKRKRLTGVGLAMPNNLDSFLKELNLSKDTFSLWSNKEEDFAINLQEVINLPVYRSNDGIAACIATYFYGVGRELDNFLYLYFGPGIGGGLVLDNEVFQGEKNNAANVGLIPVPPSTLASAPKPKNHFDIVLNRASINALVRHLEYNGIKINSALDLEDAIESSLELVDEWLDDCVLALTHLVWSSLSLLDISTIILDTSVEGKLATRLKDKLEKSLHQNTPEACMLPQIKLGIFGSDASAIGAASLPIFYSYSPTKDILIKDVK